MNERSSDKSSFRHWILFLCLLIGSVGCDQGSKSYVRDNLGKKEWIEVVPPVFSVVHVENTGAFLGMGRDLKGPPHVILMIVLPLLMLIVLTTFVWRAGKNSAYTVAALGMITGGGLGNIWDRMYSGSVTDFLHLDFGLFQTGIFNIADMMIMFGLAIFAFASRKASM